MPPSTDIYIGKFETKIHNRSISLIIQVKKNANYEIKGKLGRFVVWIFIKPSVYILL